MTDVRRAIVSALIKQDRDGFSNLILNTALKQFDGTTKERSFFSAVFYGTIERTITLDYILQKFLSKPISKLDVEVKCILRSALYQATYMNVPISAAVNEAVKLTRKMGKSSAAAMVNAVLRKAVVFNIDYSQFKTQKELISVKYSVSEQIAGLFIAQMPNDYEDVLLKSFDKPKTCIRINTLCTSIEEVEKHFESISAKTQRGFTENCLYVDYKGNIASDKLFLSGAYHVQSEPSQIISRALMAGRGEKILDLCAAPGGKSITIAQYMQNDGELLSCDKAENRLSLINTAFERMDIKCAKVLHNDAAVFDDKFSNADAVLCDVPCSGLGIMAKKPDIRLKNLSEIDELLKIQAEILCVSSRYVKKGGRLLYSTCTLNKKENEGIVKAFLDNNADFKIEKLTDLPQNARIINDCAVFYPDDIMSDGFFMALLKKQ